MESWKRRRAFCVAAITILGIVAVVGGVRAWQAYRTDAARENLTQLLAALHSYHEEHGSFPPAYVEGPDGERWHSWRALILPYVDPELAAQYSFDEPWDGPNNSRLHGRAPAAFQSPAADPPSGAAGFFAVIDRKTMWPAYQAVRMRDMVDGTSNTMMVVEDPRTDVNWLEPKDLLPGEFFRSFYDGPAWHADEGRMMGFADGAVRFIKPTIDRALLSALLTPATGEPVFDGADWPDDLRDGLLEQPFYAPRAAEDLGHTDVVAVTGAPLSPDRNQVWSAAFQLAWDELIESFGNEVPMLNPTPLTDELNSSPFDASSLSEEAVFIATSNANPDGDAILLDGLEQKFPDVTPIIHEIDGDPSVRAYAVIRKQMPFESRFDRFDEPLTFPQDASGGDVNSFGYDPRDARAAHPVYADQLEILDDQGDDDFIIRLNTSGPQRDQIILALVPPGESLKTTWESVRQRIENPNPEHDRFSLDANETLKIPILNLGLQKHFTALEGQTLNHPVFRWIDLAFLEIRLRMDETGADFVSIGEVAVVGEFGDSPEYDPQRIRRFVLDRPFFIALMEPEAEQPYFLGWIGNAELMEAFDVE